MVTILKGLKAGYIIDKKMVINFKLIHSSIRIVVTVS